MLYFAYDAAQEKESLVLASLDDLDRGTTLVNLFPSPPPVPRLRLGRRTAPVHLTGQRFAFSDLWGRTWEIDLDTGRVRDLQIRGCDPLGYLDRTRTLYCHHREDGHLLGVDMVTGSMVDHGPGFGSGNLVLPEQEWILDSEPARWVLPERPDLVAYDLRTLRRKRVVKGVDLRSGEVVSCDALHPVVQERLRR